MANRSFGYQLDDAAIGQFGPEPDLPRLAGLGCLRINATAIQIASIGRFAPWPFHRPAVSPAQQEPVAGTRIKVIKDNHLPFYEEIHRLTGSATTSFPF
jgi:hypothetical protein